MSETISSSKSSSRNRYLGIGATVALVFSILILPFVGDSSLITAIEPSLLRMFQIVNDYRYTNLMHTVSAVGFILMLLGSTVGLLFFGVRYSRGKARIGMLLCIAGLLLISGSLFDYGGNFLVRIFTFTKVGYWPSLGFFGVGYVVSWIAVILGVFAARRPPARQVEIQTARSAELGEILTPMQTSKQVGVDMVSTGYNALDGMLLGGLPPGASVVLTGPPCDEKDLIVRRFVETSLVSDRGCIYICTSIDRVRDLISQYRKNLQVILCHPQADTVSTEFQDVVKLKAIENLTDINLEYTKAFAKFRPGRAPTLCLEILDDVLLDHHGATRRWLMDILGRSKSNQMTCLATFNPAMHPPEESQAVLETFDGNIDLHEKELPMRVKVIRVKKLAGRKFLEKDLVVEKDRI